MAISLQQYVQRLAASGLMSAGELDSFQRDLLAGKRPADAQNLARALVREGKLTKYQAARVFRGDGEPLVLGNYIVLDEIGAGGMGTVYKASHRRMERIVALKLLPHAAHESPELIERFRREVRAAAMLSHPRIVTAYDADEVDGRLFLAMEFVDGPNLAELVRERSPLPVHEAVNYVVEAAEGLAYAHAQGVVHRDIKPANLLLTPAGHVKILDLGLASLHEGIGHLPAGGGALTVTGVVVGTVEYMAPEQAEDTRQADERSDVYSLGCTLYKLLTGEHLYHCDTAVKLIVAHREYPIPSLRAARPDVPARLDELFRSMVAKHPDDRPQSMEALIAALDEWRRAAGGNSWEGGGTARAGRRAESEWRPSSDGRSLSLGWFVGLAALVGLMIVFSQQRDDPAQVDSIASIPRPRMPDGLAIRQDVQASRNDLRRVQRTYAEEHGLPIIDTNALGMRLALVAPGEFGMGSDSSAVPEAERPPHRVRITRPFYIGVNEVSVGEFGRFVTETGYQTTAQTLHRGVDWRLPPGFAQSDDHPAVGLSWNDAVAFCRWLSGKEAATYRLPTEAEWEYACGASTDRAADIGRLAWYAANSLGRTHRVGLLEPNALDLSDMLGNAREWCLDGPRQYDAGAVDDPVGPNDGPRLLRGGDWSRQGVPRASDRSWSDPDHADSTTGFRVVREIPDHQ
jgi:serine/threonine-protein kinase